MKKIIILLLLIIIPGSIVVAALLEIFDLPNQGLSGNTIYDIVLHKGNIWVSTDHGVSFTEDGGVNWSYYDSSNGLVANDITAIYSNGDRLWLAVNGPSGDYLSGKGLAYTDNEGELWDTIMVKGSYGGQNTAYDITGRDSIIFFTSWAGGLLGSFDNGQTWRNIYYSRADSINYDNIHQYTDFYFSAVIDSSAEDSIVLWAGTADGLMRYTYAPNYTKPSSNYILDISSANGYTYICGDSGLTRLKFEDSVEAFYSAFESDGLPGLATTVAYYFIDRLFVGTLDSLGGEGTGLAVSFDNGLSFYTDFIGLESLAGENKYPVDFAIAGDYLFMAGFEAGLFKSADTGNTWEKVLLDTDESSGRNIVHSLVTDSAELWVGTDSGLVLLTLDLEDSAKIISSENFVFIDDKTEKTGGRSLKVRLQKYYEDENLDSMSVWVIQHPIDTNVGTWAVYYSPNKGTNWITDTMHLVGANHFDIAFNGPDVYLTGYSVFRYSHDKINWNQTQGGQVYDSTFEVQGTFYKKSITAIEIVNDTFYLGSTYGMAVSPAGSPNWHMIIADRDPQHYFTVDRYTVDDGLSGNFVNALGIQRLASGEDLIWASTHKGGVGDGVDGISVSTTDGKNWDVKHTGLGYWNFAFYNTAVFVASDSGVLFTTDLGEKWDTLMIKGNLVNFPYPMEDSISIGTQAIGVLIINDTLWVGTENGAARVSIDSVLSDEWEVYRPYQPVQDVYAFPVPFSPYDNELTYFHYPVSVNGAEATIEVYDYAMDLVKTVIRSQPKPGGILESDSLMYKTVSNDYWDGRNGKGEVVAVGMYYFKVSLSTGDIFWGKLVVMP